MREHFFNTPELMELVADWSDDDIWQPEPRRPRSAQGLRGVPRGGEPQGPADGDPRQDDQGLRHGRVRRGAEHHAPAEEDVGRVDRAASATASRFPVPDDKLEEVPYVTFPEGSPELEYMRARRMELGGYLPARRRKADAARRAGARRVRALPQEHRGPRDLDHDGVRADPADRWCATRTSASTSCRSCPTSRARSAWKACSASSASGTSRASSTRRRTPTS